MAKNTRRHAGDRGGVPADECPNRIREHRLAYRWSLDDLAKRANMTRSSLADVERGRSGIGLKRLPMLLMALGVEAHELYREVKENG